MKIGFMFPGQGAQYIGMGKDLCDNFSCAKEVFKQANDILGYDIEKVCFYGPAEELVQTKYSQPAILTVSIAALKAFESELREIRPVAAAGLSLGEYTALVCANAIKFADALRLVQQRAEFMQEASNKVSGGMASVIGTTEEEVRKLAEDKVDIANLNCPGRVVISGETEKIKQVSGLFKRLIPLDVSGPFHSRYMDPARIKLEPFINKMEVKEPNIAFMSNVTGGETKNPIEIKKCLIRQVSSSVYWEKCIRGMLAEGVDCLIEIGPGKILGGILRRINREIQYMNVEDSGSLNNAVLDFKSSKT